MARKDETYILYTFNSPHAAIKTQKLLNGLEPKVIPVLREISESCGMAVKIKIEHLEESVKIMKKSNLSKWILYKVIVSGGETSIEEIESRRDI